MLAEHLPAFDRDVPNGGYRWWYVDGISEDRQFGIVVIAFIGSVFSPYYYRARRNGAASAENYVSMNVALYGLRRKWWAMTERGAAHLRRTRDRIEVGRSGWRIDGTALEIDICERTVPACRRLRGRIRVEAGLTNPHSFALDTAGRHRWQPVAPRARMSVNLSRPSLAWRGDAYVDSNWGDRPLDRDFDEWDWCRMAGPSQTAISYRARESGGATRTLCLGQADDGTLAERPAPGASDLGATGWRLPRPALLPESYSSIRLLEDTPFYSRSLVTAGAHCGIHESLSLVRFRRPWVRLLLPFRMPRVAGG